MLNLGSWQIKNFIGIGWGFIVANISLGLSSSLSLKKNMSSLSSLSQTKWIQILKKDSLVNYLQEYSNWKKSLKTLSWIKIREKTSGENSKKSKKSFSNKLNQFWNLKYSKLKLTMSLKSKKTWNSCLVPFQPNWF